jgi:hypothetical protein
MTTLIFIIVAMAFIALLCMFMLLRDISAKLVAISWYLATIRNRLSKDDS